MFSQTPKTVLFAISTMYIRDQLFPAGADPALIAQVVFDSVRRPVMPKGTGGD